jgi:glucokinase
MKPRSPTAAVLAGVNIGGTSTTIVRGDCHGTIGRTIRFPTDSSEPAHEFYRKILDGIRNVADDASAIGVAVGGPMDAHTGTILEAVHLPNLNGFPLRDRLMRDTNAPVRVHHDAAACALAEYRWGPDAGAAGIAYLTCGTGFGAGIALDGRARYGRGGFAPELGHVRFRSDGPDIFGKPGCYEGYGSAQALALLARERDGERFSDTTPAVIAKLATEGDADACAVLLDNIEAVGSACALLADVLALDVVSLGSLSLYLGESWVAGVRASFAREALPYHVANCAVRAAMPNVQDLSALAAACDAWEAVGSPMLSVPEVQAAID